jgi:hypothetical protein
VITPKSPPAFVLINARVGDVETSAGGPSRLLRDDRTSWLGPTGRNAPGQDILESTKVHRFFGSVTACCNGT